MKPLQLADKLEVYIVIAVALPIIVAIGLFCLLLAGLLMPCKVKENQVLEKLNILNHS